MLLYHGSYMEIKNHDLSFSRFNLDFGKGFYVTGLDKQAEKWAKRRAAMVKLVDNLSNIKPIVSVYEFDINNSNLKFLRFNGYTEEWLDFVVSNRQTVEPTVNNDYDVVFGNIANDDVAAIVDDYMRLLAKDRLDAESKQFFLKQLQYSKPNDQFCMTSDKALDALVFVRSYIFER